jgi:lipopolysaccharide/colanic/teichoic acid biosynthesis glycosyltransferase
MREPLSHRRRIRHGQGIGQTAADYYEREVNYKMTRVIDWVNLNIALVVTVLIIIITLISSEVGFVSPQSMSGK